MDRDLAQVAVEFNTVGEYLLRPALEQFLQLAWSQTKLDSPSELQLKATLARLTGVPLKFNNGLRHRSLQSDERLLGFVFQPALWLRRWYFWRQQGSATTLLALTDRQIILIEEEMGRTTHGWIFTFCPLESIVEIELKAGDIWPELWLTLQRSHAAEKRQVVLEPDAARTWLELWRQYSPVGSRLLVISTKNY